MEQEKGVFRKCEVCNLECKDATEWTRHLFQDRHQRKARWAAEEWDDEMEERALLGFFDLCPESKSEEKGSDMVQIISDYLNFLLWTSSGSVQGEARDKVLITDFVWWVDKAGIMAIQFESREVAELMFTEILKRRPWKGWFTPFMKVSRFLKWHMGGLKWMRDGSVREQEEERPPRVPVSLGRPSSLIIDFQEILYSLKVPSTLAQPAAEILSRVKAQLNTHFFPQCQVDMFRNDLQIRNHLSRDLMIFCQGYIPPGSTHPGIQMLNLSEVTRVLMEDKALDPVFLEEGEAPKYDESQEFQLFSWNGPGNNLILPIPHFWVFTSHNYFKQVQLMRLRDYMLTFDPICGLLLKCLHFFCIENHCYFGVGSDRSNIEAMEWLLLFFLSREKLIPTVGEVQRQPHRRLIILRPQMEIDHGFNPDLVYAQDWRFRKGTCFQDMDDEENFTDEFIWRVVDVFTNFLAFVGNMRPDGALLINTRNAEIFDQPNLLQLDWKLWNSKLSEIEIDILQREKPLREAQLNKWPFIILHPLITCKSLDYDLEGFRKASKLMKKGALQLIQFKKDEQAPPVQSLDKFSAWSGR